MVHVPGRTEGGGGSGLRQRDRAGERGIRVARRFHLRCTRAVAAGQASEAELSSLVAQADVVLDCSDNAATRYLLNRVCFQAKKPLVSGAAIRFEGQITVFDFRQKDSPCYHCLYPEVAGEPEMRCAENGVFAPLVGMIGSMQAAEALKCLLNIGETLQGRLLLLDALTAEWQTIQFARDPACDVCGHVSL